MKKIVKLINIRDLVIGGQVFLDTAMNNDMYVKLRKLFRSISYEFDVTEDKRKEIVAKVSTDEKGKYLPKKEPEANALFREFLETEVEIDVPEIRTSDFESVNMTVRQYMFLEPFLSD